MRVRSKCKACREVKDKAAERAKFKKGEEKARGVRGGRGVHRQVEGATQTSPSQMMQHDSEKDTSKGDEVQ